MKMRSSCVVLRGPFAHAKGPGEEAQAAEGTRSASGELAWRQVNGRFSPLANAGYARVSSGWELMQAGLR